MGKRFIGAGQINLGACFNNNKDYGKCSDSGATISTMKKNISVLKRSCRFFLLYFLTFSF